MADTLDLVTLAEAKSALNIVDTTHDTELASFITAVSRRLDDLCGPIVKRTVTDELHAGGTESVILRQAPAAESATTTITSVKEYSAGTATTLTAETVTTSTTDDYSFDPTTGVLRRRSTWSNRDFATQNVVVTYSAGRYASTAAVDPKFKQAAGIMLAHLWRSTQGISGRFGPGEVLTTPFALPNAVVDLLAGEIQPPVVG